jgi:hypothetical protein
VAAVVSTVGRRRVEEAGAARNINPAHQRPELGIRREEEEKE